jgi:hypothetical protein
MVVVAAGAKERRVRPHPLHQLETQHVAVERQRPIEIGDLQVDVADVNP